MVKQKIFGVGINDANYSVHKTVTRINEDGTKLKVKVWTCPYYRAWKDMIKRSYCPSFKLKEKTYANVTVCEEWHTFSSFKAWMEGQDWQGKTLDKDLLSKDVKIYSPETCCFVSQKVNSFLTDSRASRGKFPIGVCKETKSETFFARCCNPFTGKRESLGRFKNPEDAHEAWRKRKRFLSHALASMETDSRVIQALLNKY